MTTRDGNGTRWKARRVKYGQKGHNGSYSRRCAHCQSMIEMIVRLYAEGLLSEGQTAKVTGIPRIELRKKADALGQQYDPT